MKKNIVLNSAFLFCLTVVLFFACSKKSSDTSTQTPPPATNGNTVSISNFSFVSNALTVTAGTTVTWTNNDSAPHTVTADDNSFTSGNLSKGDTYSHKFTGTGTFNYHCNVHPMMTASVIVK